MNHINPYQSTMRFLRKFYRKIYQSLPKPWIPPTKYEAELGYWKTEWLKRGNSFQNSWYRGEMLAMAGEPDDKFMQGKIVADFGCGPLGSLTWATSAALRIGIDILADQYIDVFKEYLISHGMVYVKSTEKNIPIPSNFVDILFSMNAMDHVDDLKSICCEVLRILKPGGELIGSFNLNEPPSCCEPQCLNEDAIKTHLLNKMEITSYKIAKTGSSNNPRQNLLENKLEYKKGLPGIMWVRASKK
jgi:SAM-dependent methyltransferase